MLCSEQYCGPFLKISFHFLLKIQLFNSFLQIGKPKSWQSPKGSWEGLRPKHSFAQKVKDALGM